MLRDRESAEKKRVFPHAPATHPVVEHGRIGVLLVNLGTPDGTDYRSIRRFLREFLSDHRVVELNRVFWWILLNGFILTFRPQKTACAYKEVWDYERGESPLRVFTRAQAAKLSDRFLDSENVVVDWAMRYGQPSISDVMRRMKESGCTRILFFPLYPQYSATTTGTAVDMACQFLSRARWQPALRIVPPFYDEPAYIDALAESIGTCISGIGFEPERILVSYHGLPVSFLEKGDPYYCHCSKTTRLLREKLGLSAEKMQIVFQSRFGRAEWLKPYTDQVIKELGDAGIKKLLIVSPSFFSDCIETLEELQLQGAELFKEHGGTDFACVPCLNDSELGINVLESLARRELSGWI